mgnify:CR=1 FL=1
MISFIDEIDSEIDLEDFKNYIDNIILLENTIEHTLNRRNYSTSYQNVIRYIHLDLLWSIDIFNKLIIYKIADEIYFKKIIKLIK